MITSSRRKELVNPLSVSVIRQLLTLAPICRWHRDLLWIYRWKHSICWYLSAVFLFCKRPYTEIPVSVSHCPRRWTALIFICNTMWFSPTDGWFPDCCEFRTSVQHSQWFGTVSPRNLHLWRTKLIFHIASTMSWSNTSMLPWYEIHCLIPVFADCIRIRSCYTGSSVSHFRSTTYKLILACYCPFLLTGDLIHICPNSFRPRPEFILKKILIANGIAFSLILVCFVLLRFVVLQSCDPSWMPNNICMNNI